MTTRDPYLYIGSGKDWVSHIKSDKIKRKDITTIVMFSSEDENEFSKKCLIISDFLNIVNDDRFLNKIVESGKALIIHTEEMKEAKRLHMLEKWKDESYRSSRTGFNHSMYGTKREDTSLMNINRFKNKSEREKASNNMKLMWLDEDYKNKISLLMSGENNPSKQPEVSKKISETKKAKFANGELLPINASIYISPDGVRYSGSAEACRAEGLNISPKSLARWCRLDKYGWKSIRVFNRKANDNE